MFRFLSVVAISLLLSMTGSADPNHEPMERGELHGTITVSGRSTIMLTPSVVRFTAGVQTRAETVREAVEENNRRTRAVIDALKEAGADEDELQTRNFSVWPEIHFDEKTRRQSIDSYRVSNEIVVRKDDPAAASRLLQAAIDAGANTSSGLDFIVADPAAGDDEGLVAAYLNAKAKAELLAQAAGRTLGMTISVTEGATPGSPPQPVRYRAEAAMMDASTVPVESGREEKNYVVTVVFALD